MPADRLLVFARRPAAGRVKTRLTPPLAPADAASVYEACLRDVIATAARERARVELWYDPESDAEAYFAGGFRHLYRQPQAHGDLGQRMADAFARSFDDGAARAVIVGSDVPTLSETAYGAAFDHLHEAAAVIGPALDGGYYLIGLAADAWPRGRRLFEQITWSDTGVYAATIDRAVDAGLELRVLPGWYDVDRPDDLRRARADALAESHLGRLLRSPDLAQQLDLA
jgi:uncharacterized protein